MASQVVHTLISPSIVTAPLFRSDIHASPSRIATTLKSLATTVMATATESPAFLPTSSIPADMNLPLANGERWNPTIAILSLVAVVIFGVILLTAISYFIFLRFRGKCPNCPQYEDELNKWKRGDLKPITSTMVQERMQAWDLEKGGMDLQVKMYKDRMKSLATLEGRTLDGQAESVWSENTDYEKEEVKEYVGTDAKLKEPSAAHLAATDARWISEDPEATLVAGKYIFNDTGHPKTHSAYLRDVVAPREAEAKRSLQEAEERMFTRLCNTASDPTNRESVQDRAKLKIKEMIMAREEQEEEEEEQRTQMPAPRQGHESRFKERFSLATHDNQIIN